MRSFVLCLLIAICSIVPTADGQESGTQHWRSSQILESVVLIQSYDVSTESWRPFGTGVTLDLDTTLPYIYLVTNRHIYIGRDTLALQMNVYAESDSQSFFAQPLLRITAENTVAFCPNTSDSDFAIIRLDRPKPKGQYNPLPAEKIISFDSLQYGEQVEFYGFPAYSQFGLSAAKFQFPVCRGGTIAYFTHDDVYYSGTKYMTPGMFLIDGVSIGGNSGGPVFIKRSYVSKTPNGGLTVSYDRRLAGIVSKHYPIRKTQRIPLSKIPLVSTLVDSLGKSADSTWISQMSADFVFEYDENSNLAVIISMDIILDYLSKQLDE